MPLFYRFNMHTAAKVLLILGTIVTVIGIAGFAIGIGQIDDFSDSWNSFEVEDGTNGTITIDDSDDQGELGLTFWVKGVYEDLDGNGIWDVCDITNVEVTENPEIIVSEWSSGAASLDGKFYNEVIWNYDENSTSDCKAVQENKEFSREDNGLVKIGRACYGCGSGDFVFESNQSVWVTYDDKIEEELGESGVLLGLGFLGGFGGVCCGVLLLIVGGVLALGLIDEKQQIMYAPPAANQMVTNNDQDVAPLTITTPNVTHMSAPTFDEPPQDGL